MDLTPGSCCRKNKSPVERLQTSCWRPGGDSHVLRVPSYVLSFVGSSYVFQLSAVVDEMSNTVNATGET